MKGPQPWNNTVSFFIFFKKEKKKERKKELDVKYFPCLQTLKITKKVITLTCLFANMRTTAPLNSSSCQKNQKDKLELENAQNMH